MKTIALYARVSSEQQTQQATIESQIAVLRQRAVADGHVVLEHDLYIDEGFSGSTLARPALERLRDRVADRAIDLLYVLAPDRLARKYAYQVLLLEELKAHGVGVIFLQGTVGTTAEEALLVQMQGMIAEYERAKILERSRRGKLHRARSGSVSPLSAAPYGFRYQRRTEREDAAYVPMLSEAKVVRDIFDAFVNQQRSLRSILADLQARRIVAPRGGARWSPFSLARLLQNPAYIGKAAFGRSEACAPKPALRPAKGRPAIPKRVNASRATSPDRWISIDVPRLVSDEIFDAAQRQLARNRELAQRNARPERYLLQGLTVCACCQYTYYGKAVSGKSLRYYRCLGADRRRDVDDRVCRNRPINAIHLDEHVWRSVREAVQDPQRLMEEWTRRLHTDTTSNALQQQRDHAARSLAANERALRRLVDAYEAGALELAELQTRNARLRDQVTRVRNDLANAERALADVARLREIVTHFDEFTGRVRDGLERLTWKERQQLVRLLVTRVEINADGACIVYRIPARSSAVPLQDDPSSDDDRPPPSSPLHDRNMPEEPTMPLVAPTSIHYVTRASTRGVGHPSHMLVGLG